jgi:hypothetical protein
MALDWTKLLANSGMGLQLAGVITGANASYNSAKTNQGTMRYQAGLDRNNAQIAQWQAQQAQAVGAFQSQQALMKGADIKGSQVATLAANGVDVGSDSAQHILNTTDYLANRDAMMIQDNASRTAWAYQQQGANSTNTANFLDATANSINPTQAGFNTALGSLGTVASSWYRLNKDGVWG